MDSKTQPILCCIGESVAGKPTQFVMERAFSASGLDWRALTVEVDSASMQAALRGIKAMKFQAARFFPSCQGFALEEFMPDDALSRFVGGITSASLDEDEWHGWHNLGQGILLQLSRLVDWPSSICWLHGNSERTRSLSLALLQRPCKAVFWTDAPSELPEELVRRLPVQNPADQLAINRIPQDEIADCISAAGGDALAIVSDGLLGNLADGAIAERCSLLSDHFEQVIVVVNDLLTDEFAKLLPAATLVSEAEQAVAAEAYDFGRWTSTPADFDLIRDAYDEYCDF